MLFSPELTFCRNLCPENFLQESSSFSLQWLIIMFESQMSHMLKLTNIVWWCFYSSEVTKVSIDSHSSCKFYMKNWLQLTATVTNRADICKNRPVFNKTENLPVFKELPQNNTHFPKISSSKLWCLESSQPSKLFMPCSFVRFFVTYNLRKE